jgi:hypothetical protein
MAYARTAQLLQGGGKYSKYGLSGSRWNYLKTQGFQIRVASNVRSIEGKQKVTSKYAADIPNRVLSEVVDWQLERARRYSSGTISKERLRQYKPGKYSVKRPAQVRDYIINAHRGTFREGWRRRPVSKSGNSFFVSIFNVSMPVAAFLLLGTRIMRERPLLRKVQEESRAIINRVMTRERMRLLRAWRKGGRGKMEVHGA